MYVEKQEFKDLVAAVVANGERIEMLEKKKRQEMEVSIYNSLPLAVQAAMIDEEFAVATREMEGI